MDPMDQFYKNKLKDRRYSYKDTYWEEAEHMIVQREGRRRAAGWWWFGLGMLLLIIAGSGWWWMGRKDVEPVPEAVEIGIASGIERSPNASIERLPEGPGEGKSITKSTLDAETDGQADNRPGGSRPEIAAQPVSGDAEYAGQRNTSSASGENLAGETFTDPSEKEAIPGSSEKAEGPTVENFRKDTVSVHRNSPIAVRESERLNIESVVSLLGPVETKPAILGMSPSVNERSIRPASRFSWELALAAMVNPSNGKRLLGGLAGLRSSYRLNEKLALVLGAQYRLRGGTFGPSQESRAVAYRFGREETVYRLEPNRLHYAEALLQLEWIQKRHHFSAGIGWNHLIGVEGRLSSAVKEEFALSFGSSANLEKGWLDEGGYKKQFWSGLAAYHYQLLNRLKLGMELQYTPGGILEEGLIPESPLLKETSPLIIGLGIKYRL